MFDFGLTARQEDRARKLHEASFVVNMLCSVVVHDEYFRQAKQGGITVDSHSIIGETPGSSEINWNYEATVAKLADYLDMFRKKSDELVHVTNVSDIKRAKANGKLGIILNFQDSTCIGDDIERLDMFYKMGVCVIQLTYNWQSLSGVGCLERGNGGLSEFGAKVIRRMNEVGIVVDTSHSNEATTMDAIETSEKPMICSHVNIKSFCDTPRCLGDEALKMLASKNGVVGLTYLPGFMKKTGRCTINDYLDQIDYAVKLMGVDHVGLGLDSCTGTTPDHIFESEQSWGEGAKRIREVHLFREIWPPESAHDGFEDESKAPNVTRGLVARGYKDGEIKKILGGNWMRLLEEVQG